ncbi:MAG: NAD(P)/FAD-dependent oxidoreductase [Cyanobacteria bacterium HKST-UBA02]|nr:NAD(P)/FAD-dependent oxidoreductase [Cyanobacteria bacterium HKST-UBA02]
MTKHYDAIIIGAGHNGLVTAGYLARAGMSVLVLEKRDVVGGACVTEEVWPGYKVSTLSYLCSLLMKNIVEDLELRRFGYHIYPKNPSFFTAFPDGRHIFFYQDMKKTQEQIAKFSKRDAEYFPKYEHELARLAEWIEQLLVETPPNIVRRRFSDMVKLGSLGLHTLALNDGELPRLVRVMTQSVKDYLDERFESEEIKTTLATDGVIGTNGGPSTPGTAYILLHHVMGDAAGQRGLWGFVRGGMGGISTALARSAEAHNAEILTGVGVSHITIKNDRACGAVLDDGREFTSDIVISNADPKRTFLKLMNGSSIDSEFRAQVEGSKCLGSSFKINLALDGLPQFKAFPTPEGEIGDPHRTTIHICPSMDYMDKAWEDAQRGEPSQGPMLECTIPTAYDDSIAPDGKHIMCMFVQYAPYKLRDGLEWNDELKNKFADRCIDLLAEYAPNIKDIIIHRQAISAMDMETEYNLTGGSLFHGDMGLDQLFFMRPVPGWARYRTPVDNLYLCGSGTHPGGGVMGAPGYNAAREIIKDRKKGKIKV